LCQPAAPPAGRTRRRCCCSVPAESHIGELLGSYFMRRFRLLLARRTCMLAALAANVWGAAASCRAQSAAQPPSLHTPRPTGDDSSCPIMMACPSFCWALQPSDAAHRAWHWATAAAWARGLLQPSVLPACITSLPCTPALRLRRFRHLLLDLCQLLPHCKRDAKLDSKSERGVINEVADMKVGHGCGCVGVSIGGGGVGGRCCLLLYEPLAGAVPLHRRGVPRCCTLRRASTRTCTSGWPRHRTAPA
jgi:hypothetical protein